MAMIRVLWDIAYCLRFPDFKEDPFDLGTFDEITHHRGARGGRADTFEAALADDKPYRLEVTFGKKGTIPVPVRRRIADGDTWIEDRIDATPQSYELHVGTRRGTWKKQLEDDVYDSLVPYFDAPERLWGFAYMDLLLLSADQWENNVFAPLPGSPVFNKEDYALIYQLAMSRTGPIRERGTVRRNGLELARCAL